jgi:hypothetical protein
VAYFAPLPAFDRGAPRVGAISATYPLGAEVSVSGGKWDARGAVVNSAPTRIFEIGERPYPPSTAFFEAGAGITPIIGLRIGASFAGGDYVSRNELPAGSAARSMRQAGVEAEFAFRYTKVSAELVRDAFDTSGARAEAYEWFAQAMQTVAPRWFVAGRTEGVSAPGLQTSLGTTPRTIFRTAEGTVGFRLTPEFTLRASIVGRKAFARDDWDRQVGASIVWARRWW